MTAETERQQPGDGEQERIRQQRRRFPRGTAEETRLRRRSLRPLRRADLPAVRLAHAELFPIDYEEAFYEAVAEGTGGVFALGLFDGEGDDGERQGLTSLPALFSSSPSTSSGPSSSSAKLIAFVTARLQNASHIDRTDAAYLGLLEEAEAEARAEAEATATAAAATTAAEATTAQAETTMPLPPPPQQPLGPGGNLLGPAPTRPIAAYVLTLGVSKHRRGEGIGRLLVSAVAERAAAAISDSSSSLLAAPPSSFWPDSRPAAALVYLHVAAFNPAAVSLYQACGFSRLATLQDFYSISTARRPDPEKVLYDAHLFAMRIDGGSSSSSASSWPFPLPPPPLLAPAPPPPPLLPPLPPAVEALAGALFWLSSLASSLLTVAFGAKRKNGKEEEAETIPTTTKREEEEAPSAAPWLSRLFRRE